MTHKIPFHFYPLLRKKNKTKRTSYFVRVFALTCLTLTASAYKISYARDFTSPSSWEQTSQLKHAQLIADESDSTDSSDTQNSTDQDVPDTQDSTSDVDNPDTNDTHNDSETVDTPDDGSQAAANLEKNNTINATNSSAASAPVSQDGENGGQPDTSSQDQSSDYEGGGDSQADEKPLDDFTIDTSQSNPLANLKPIAPPPPPRSQTAPVSSGVESEAAPRTQSQEQTQPQSQPQQGQSQNNARPPAAPNITPQQPAPQNNEPMPAQNMPQGNVPPAPPPMTQQPAAPSAHPAAPAPTSPTTGSASTAKNPSAQQDNSGNLPLPDMTSYEGYLKRMQAYQRSNIMLKMQIENQKLLQDYQKTKGGSATSILSSNLLGSNVSAGQNGSSTSSSGPVIPAVLMIVGKENDRKAKVTFAGVGNFFVVPGQVMANGWIVTNITKDSVFVDIGSGHIVALPMQSSSSTTSQPSSYQPRY